MENRRLLTAPAAACLTGMLILSGCNSSDAPTELTQLEKISRTAKFSDAVESNREDDGTLGSIQFVDTEGNPVTLDSYRNKKNLLVVFTRGFSGQLCPYCTTQTSRLIANYDEFTARDTEVLLVYPGSKEQLPMFKEASVRLSEKDRFPFPVLLDEGLDAVEKLDIVAQLASPSTFIIDKEGQVRLSYVGASPADRPSIRALLDQLDALEE